MPYRRTDLHRHVPNGHAHRGMEAAGAAAARPGPSTLTPYARLRQASAIPWWQYLPMKSMLLAACVFLVGVALINAVPGVDLVPGGVRAVLEEVDGIW